MAIVAATTATGWGQGLAAPAGGQDPEVSMVRAVDHGVAHRDAHLCGDAADVHAIPGQVVYERSGPVDDPLDIRVELEGELADLLVDHQIDATFATGESQVQVLFELTAPADGSLVAVLQPDPAIDLGGDGRSPLASVGDDVVVSECTEGIARPTPPASQTIEVGARPAPLHIPLGPEQDIEASGLPPGIAVEVLGGEVANLGWSGAATTPGPYDVVLRRCTFELGHTPHPIPGVDGGEGAPIDLHEARTWCDGLQRLRIVVVEGAPPSTPPAPQARPATPVAAVARLTG